MCAGAPVVGGGGCVGESGELVMERWQVGWARVRSAGSPLYLRPRGKCTWGGYSARVNLHNESVAKCAINSSCPNEETLILCKVPVVRPSAPCYPAADGTVRCLHASLGRLSRFQVIHRCAVRHREHPRPGHGQSLGPEPQVRSTIPIVCASRQRRTTPSLQGASPL
jgi:hypothetical protein